MRPIENLIETGVYADDLDQAERFYGDVLGLPVIEQGGRAARFLPGGRPERAPDLPPRGDPAGDHLPAHGCRGPGHFALGIDALDLDAWRAPTWREQHCDRARGVLAPRRSFPLFPRPGGQPGRADHPGHLGPAIGMVTACEAVCVTMGVRRAVRVLMTGGYGCIGSWVAKQLVEAGRGGLDLRPQGGHPPARPDARPARRAAEVHFVAGRRLRPRGRPRGRRRVPRRRTSCTWRACRRRPAGPIRSSGPRST